MKVYRALTIAGSDSGGGAGIQADLKTFAALGVHGMSAITAITAQNTVSVTGIMKVDPEMVRKQIRAVVEDIGVDAIKTGMLYSEDIIEVVSDEASKIDVPLVVDPVMMSKTGAPLLRQEAMRAMRELLIPKATVVTPNAHEAEKLAGIKVNNLRAMEEAAKRIARLGAKGVVIKGGHIKEVEALDVLLYDGKLYHFKAKRLPSDTTHGTGCSFASAIAAYLAKGLTVPQAVKEAKGFINEAIEHGLRVGRGVGPVNPMAKLYKDAERYEVMEELHESINLLEELPKAGLFIPKCRTNFGYALSYAKGRGDVATVPGGMIRHDDRMKAVGHPEFGISDHIADVILQAMKFDEKRRSAMNLKHSKELLIKARELGMSILCLGEREGVEGLGGKNMRWNIEPAIKLAGKVPDLIEDLGGLGKEPMIILLGNNPKDVVEKLREAVKRL
jgi:hydroxymethylpyrimidine/phosphomethylpyrimidine kinase